MRQAPVCLLRCSLRPREKLALQAPSRARHHWERRVSLSEHILGKLAWGTFTEWEHRCQG